MSFKKLIALLLTLMLIVSLTSCGGMKVKTDGLEDLDSVSDVKGEETEKGYIDVYGEYDLSDYIQLGTYKGLEVTVDNSPVTDEDVTNYIKSNVLISYAESTSVTSGPIQNGDYVTMDFTGYVDGVAFDGGSGTNTQLQVGSGQFIPGFEDGMIGKNIGEEFQIDVTFPEDYMNEDLEGKPATFVVTVHEAIRYTYPDFTDDFVKENLEGYDTVNEYLADTKTMLEDSKKASMEDNVKNAVYNKILETSKIIKTPSSEVTYYASDTYNSYESMASYYGYESLEKYLSEQFNTDLQTFVSECESLAQTSVEKDLILAAILEAEGIKIDDDKYYEMLESYLVDAGASDTDELEATYTNKRMSLRVMADIAIKIAVDNATVNYTSAE